MAGRCALETYQVLLGVLVTEKSTQQRLVHNQFTFRVPVSATKSDIRMAVLEAFGVKATSVSTQLYKECAVRYKSHHGYSRAWKKAIVTVGRDETLSV